MAFSFRRILSGISIFGSSDRTKKLNIDVNEGSTTTNTTTTIRAQQSANRTIVLPDASDTLVGKATTDVLTNKTIDGDDNTVQDLALTSLKTNITDANKFLERDGSGVVISSNKAVPSGAVVGSSDSQTLTNKSIDADSNTITNIDNADIKAGANIARSKLAAGTADHVIINDGSGNFSSEAALAKVRGGTGADNSSVTFPASGVIVTEAATQTLTGKTIDGDNNTVQDLALTAIKTNITDASKFIVRDASGIPVSNTKDVPSGVVVGTTDTQTLSGKTLTSAIISEGADFIEDDSISSPSAGRRRLQLKTDGKLYLRDSSGNEVAIGSGGGSGINYVLNPSAEANTDGYATYADAAGVAPVDGTGGSPTVTWTRSTSSPLRNLANFLLTKDANNRQGEGVAYAFSIDSADQGKVLQGSFDYAIGSGTFADNDVSVWIYDVTNSTLIQPAPYQLKNHALPSERFPFEFQASSSSTSYRLIIHIASTSASAYTLKFDNFNVGPQAKLYGSPVQYLGTETWTDSEANATTSVKVQRVGNRAVAEGVSTFTGAFSGSGFTVTIPAKYTADDSGDKFVGSASFRDSGSADYLGGILMTSTTTLSIQFVNASIATARLDGPTSTTPYTWASGDKIFWQASWIVASWGDSVVMSTDADTRVVAARAHLSSNQTGIGPNNSNIKIALNAVQFDTHGGFDTSNNRYIVKVPGKYRIDGHIYTAGTNVLNNQYLMRIFKNGSAAHIGNGTYPPATGNIALSASTTLDLVAGDYIELFLYGAGNNSASTITAIGDFGESTNLSIERISGPSQIAASESVLFRGTNTAGTSISNSGDVVVPFATTSFSTHGGWSTDTYTAPVSGKYEVYSQVWFSSSAAVAGNRAYMIIQKNGSNVTYGPLTYIFANATSIFTTSVQDTIQLLAGETIKIAVNYNRTAGATTLDTAAGENFVTIKRVGNY